MALASKDTDDHGEYGDYDDHKGDFLGRRVFWGCGEKFLGGGFVVPG